MLDVGQTCNSSLANCSHRKLFETKRKSESQSYYAIGKHMQGKAEGTAPKKGSKNELTTPGPLPLVVK